MTTATVSIAGLTYSRSPRTAPRVTAPYTKASAVPPSPDSQENIGKYSGWPLSGKKAPTTTTDMMIARGMVLAGSLVSSPRLAAVSNPVKTRIA